ncbi:unnamed protein product [Trichobilharzia regenti]|nr:unnamed protein product [Trichobilharzia regenti]
MFLEGHLANTSHFLNKARLQLTVTKLNLNRLIDLPYVLQQRTLNRIICYCKGCHILINRSYLAISNNYVV